MIEKPKNFPNYRQPSWFALENLGVNANFKRLRQSDLVRRWLASLPQDLARLRSTCGHWWRWFRRKRSDRNPCGRSPCSSPGLQSGSLEVDTSRLFQTWLCWCWVRSRACRSWGRWSRTSSSPNEAWKRTRAWCFVNKYEGWYVYCISKRYTCSQINKKDSALFRSAQKGWFSRTRTVVLPWAETRFEPIPAAFGQSGDSRLNLSSWALRSTWHGYLETPATQLS